MNLSSETVVKTIQITVRDMTELADLLFPVQKKERQLGMFENDNKRGMARDETAGLSPNGRPRQKHRKTQRVR